MKLVNGRTLDYPVSCYTAYESITAAENCHLSAISLQAAILAFVSFLCFKLRRILIIVRAVNKYKRHKSPIWNFADNLP